jgi:hypothetical protein
MADIHSLGGLPRGELRALWIQELGERPPATLGFPCSNNRENLLNFGVDRSRPLINRVGVGGEGFAGTRIEIKHVAAPIELQRGAPFKRRQVIEHIA